MSHWSDVVDAWVAELTDNVDGLAELPDSVIHKYAPWSLEALAAVTNERHLAVWPQSEPDVVEGYVAGSPPEDLATQRYVILVWEDASAESTRRMDDEQANLDWLDLHEAIRDRLYDLSNRNLGDPQIMDTRYQGVAFDVRGTGRPRASGGLRVMVVQFQTRRLHAFTS